MTSALAAEMRHRLSQYLSHETTLVEFSDWLSPIVWDIEERHDPEAEELAYDIYHPMAEQSGGYITEDDLRHALRPLLHPAPVTAAS